MIYITNLVGLLALIGLWYYAIGCCYVWLLSFVALAFVVVLVVVWLVGRLIRFS